MCEWVNYEHSVAVMNLLFLIQSYIMFYVSVITESISWNDCISSYSFYNSIRSLNMWLYFVWLLKIYALFLRVRQSGFIWFSMVFCRSHSIQNYVWMSILSLFNFKFPLNLISTIETMNVIFLFFLFIFILHKEQQQQQQNM